MEKLSVRLKKLRIRKGFSQVYLAKLINVPVTTYRDWEGGKAITGEPYPFLAQHLDVSISYLITGQQTDVNDILNYIDKVIDDVKNLRKSVIALI